jgi:spermidine/putrescine transport system substrate-binding protein
MIDDNPDLAWVFPEEGTNMSIDNMCIPATSANKEAAEMFINYMCETDVGVANCEYIGYSTPMHDVWENLDDSLKYSPIAYPDEAVKAKMQVFTVLDDNINAELDAQWSALKSYNESGNAWLVPVFLLCALGIAGFNIWRKMRKKFHNNY